MPEMEVYAHNNPVDVLLGPVKSNFPNHKNN